MKSEEIISFLPFDKPFLFVDEITSISSDSIEGHYTFDKDAFFYRGHFKGFPITPGAILGETMAQIGVVSLGIFLMKDELVDDVLLPQVALTSSDLEFYLPVYPGELVIVKSEKIYFRFNKLKCHVKLYNGKNNLVCKGDIAGMLKVNKDE